MRKQLQLHSCLETEDRAEQGWSKKSQKEVEGVGCHGDMREERVEIGDAEMTDPVRVVGGSLEMGVDAREVVSTRIG